MRTFKVTISGTNGFHNYWFEIDSMAKAYRLALAIKAATNANDFTVVEYSQLRRHDGETLMASLPASIGSGLC